jgi:hypothetical protein
VVSAHQYNRPAFNVDGFLFIATGVRQPVSGTLAQLPTITLPHTLLPRPTSYSLSLPLTPCHSLSLLLTPSYSLKSRAIKLPPSPLGAMNHVLLWKLHVR